MTTDKPNPEQLTRKEMKEARSAIKRQFFEKMGLDPNLSDQKIRFGAKSNLSAKEQLKLAMAKGLQIGLDRGIDQLLSEVQTKGDIHNAMEALEAVGERGPTLARETMDQIRTQLRRRGGPGREPLLSEEKAVKACDKISEFIRLGCSEAEAISKTSDRSVELLGKKVGKRTLKTKAWDRRAELTKGA